MGILLESSSSTACFFYFALCVLDDFNNPLQCFEIRITSVGRSDRRLAIKSVKFNEKTSYESNQIKIVRIDDRTDEQDEPIDSHRTQLFTPPIFFLIFFKVKITSF